MYTVYNVYIPHFQTNTRIGMSQVIQIMCSPTAHISPPAEPVLAEPVASVRWEKRIGRDAVTCYQQCYLFSHVSNFLSFLQFPSSVPSITVYQNISKSDRSFGFLAVSNWFTESCTQLAALEWSWRTLQAPSPEGPARMAGPWWLIGERKCYSDHGKMKSIKAKRT